MIDFSFWYMFPVGILISSIAMMSGIGGAVMFSPFFLLVLKLEPIAALATALFVEIFGFTSGVIGYLRDKSINFHTVKILLPLAVAGTISGVIVGKFFSPDFLKLILAFLLFYLSYCFLLSKKKCQPKHPSHTGSKATHREHLLEPVIRATTFFGAVLVGMISSGLGEVNEYNFLRRLRMHIPTASGTSVFLVAVCAIIGVITHMLYFVRSGEFTILSNIFSIVLFTVPGVVLGAQFGVHLAHKVREESMGMLIGSLFLVLASLVLATIL